jgi:hypothetical protein
VALDIVIPVLKVLQSDAMAVVNRCFNEMELGVFVEEVIHVVMIVVSL